MSETLYILTRTSRRPKLFARLRETVKALTWPGAVVHIVHSDDPRDTYVEGDIIIRGESLDDIRVKRRRGSYNLYNNRLLDVIPGDGWVHFMDDDDEYAAPDVFEKLLTKADPQKVNVGHVCRGPGIYFPKYWGTQKSFQTEIPFMRTEIAKQSRWPATKGGDHTYNRPLVRKYGVNWIDDVLIATTNEGKGNGRRNDVKGSASESHNLPPGTMVYVKPMRYEDWAPYTITIEEAEEMAEKVDLMITYEGVTAEYLSVPAPANPVRFDQDVPIITGHKKDVKALLADAIALGIGPERELRMHSRVWLERAIRRGTPDGYKEYQRIGTARMRPYIEGEDLDGVITSGREPKTGDMIAKDLLDPNRIWLVPHDAFARYYREMKQ